MIVDLGNTDAGNALYTDVEAVNHTVGAAPSRVGKSRLAASLVDQRIQQGSGGLVIDPKRNLAKMLAEHFADMLPLTPILYLRLSDPTVVFPMNHWLMCSQSALVGYRCTCVGSPGASPVSSCPWPRTSPRPAAGSACAHPGRHGERSGAPRRPLHRDGRGPRVGHPHHQPVPSHGRGGTRWRGRHGCRDRPAMHPWSASYCRPGRSPRCGRGRAVWRRGRSPRSAARLCPAPPHEGEGDERWRRSHARSAYGHAGGADQRDPEGGGLCAPALWSSSSASQAVPVLTAVGALSCSWAWMRCRRVWRGVRDPPHSRARRAVGSPVAIPRHNSTKVAGRCRGFAKTGPVSQVEEPSQARQR
jgi:hypothetical protein